MPRPQKCRRVSFVPGVTYFKPAGIPLRDLDEVRLSMDEAESIRLKDLEGLDQENSANRMNVSRPTYQRILVSARRKLADALLNGKAIRIEGGHFETPLVFRCESGHEWESVIVGLSPPTCPMCKSPGISSRTRERADVRATAAQPGGETLQLEEISDARKSEKVSGGRAMKIAVISDDGTTISQHFGMASLYVVATAEDGKVISKETRPKAGHHTLGGGHHEAVSGERHGYDAAAQATHATMVQNVDDCEVLIAGGMGWGARDSLESRGIKTVITDVENIDDAVERYITGNLPNLVGRLH